MNKFALMQKKHEKQRKTVATIKIDSNPTRKEQKISKFETTMKDYAIKTFMIEDDQINKNEKNCIKRENVDKKNISQWAEQIKQKVRQYEAKSRMKVNVVKNLYLKTNIILRENSKHTNTFSDFKNFMTENIKRRIETIQDDQQI